MNPSLFLKFSHWVISTSSRPFDFADSLHFPWTSVLILSFVCTLWLKQYIFKPLQCWVPQEFSRPWEEYAEYYCWVTDTYFNPIDRALPENSAERTEKRITYYQWVPFVLLVQGICFFIPCAAWSLLSSRSSIPLTALLRSAREATVADRDQRNRVVTYVARCMIDMLLHNSDRRRSKHSLASCSAVKSKQFSRQGCSFGSRAGNYLTWVYFLMKLIFIANAIGHIYLVTIFTQTEYTFYGYELLRDVIRGDEWQKSGRFPRVTWCDFQVRTVGNVHMYSIMCVLPSNMLNEKIYIFLWWWFAFISGVTFLSMLVWIKRLAFQRSRRMFVCKFLKYMDALGADQDKRMWQTFVDYFLHHDGVFVLHLIADKSGEIIAGEVVCQIYQFYRQNGTDKKHIIQKKMNGMSEAERYSMSYSRKVDGIDL